MKLIVILTFLSILNTSAFGSGSTPCPEKNPTSQQVIEDHVQKVQEALRHDRKFQKIRRKNTQRLQRWKKGPSGGDPNCVPGWTKCW